MHANDRQVGGSHYAQKDGGEQHWDRVARLGLDYFQGQITKYVERCWLKNGLQDLQKAKHFIEKYIELKTPVPVRPSLAADIAAAAEPGPNYINQDQTGAAWVAAMSRKRLSLDVTVDEAHTIHRALTYVFTSNPKLMEGQPNLEHLINVFGEALKSAIPKS